MEGTTGVELLALAQRLAGGTVTLAIAVAMIGAGIRGAGGKVPPDLGDLVLREGILSVLRQISGWLAGVFAGDTADAVAEYETDPKKA